MARDQLVLLFLGECYYRLQCQKRPLFLCDLATVSTEWSEVLTHICNTYSLRVGIPRGIDNAFYGDANAAVLSTLIQGMLEEHEFDDHELIVFVFCRVYFNLKWITGGSGSSFLQRQELLSILKKIKLWVIDLLSVSLGPPLKVSFNREYLQKSLSTFLGAHGLLSPDCSVKLADFLITSAFCQKHIFFIPQNFHAKLVYYSLDPSRELSIDHVVFEQAVCLPFSFSVGYLKLCQFLSNPGKILLFCCSLDLEADTLREFIEFLQLVNVFYLASQKVLGASVKEALFDVGIFPIERLSLCHTDAAQCATGATPFHSLHEFVSWVKALEHVSEDSQKHLGFVRKATMSRDKSFLWIYGDKNIATVLLPVRSIAFNKAVVNICERAYIYTQNSIGYANNIFFQGKSTCVFFLAEYLRQRCLFSGVCSESFCGLVDIVCQTLLYRVFNCDSILCGDLLEYTKLVAGRAAMKLRESLAFEEQERSLNLADASYHFVRTIEVVAGVLDSLSLVLQMGQG